MASQPFLEDPGRVDEPAAAPDFSDALTRVATDHRPLIVRRGGRDLAAVIPLEYWELLRELLAGQDVERLAAQIDWDWAVKTLRPPQEWFDGDEPKPF